MLAWHRVVSLVAVVSIAACTRTQKSRSGATHTVTRQAAKGTSALSATPIGVVQSGTSVVRKERYAIDLDGDGRLDTLEVRPTPHPDGPGIFNGLYVALASGGRDSVAGDWDPAGDDFPMAGNLLPTRTAFVQTYPRAGTLIFLFGESVGCCLQSLDIFRVRDHRLQRYFHSDEFSLVSPPEVDPDSGASLAAVTSLSEGVDNTDTLQTSTYNPVIVYRLEQSGARIDTAASIEATRYRLGGYAGLAPNDDVLVVRHQFLTDLKRRQRFP